LRGKSATVKSESIPVTELISILHE